MSPARISPIPVPWSGYTGWVSPAPGGDGRKGSLSANRTRSAGVRGFAFAGFLLLLAPPESGGAADADGWALDIGGDRAAVTLGETRTAWWTGRVQLGWRREGTGGAFVAVEPLRRFDATDTTFIAAGWRHAGPWSAYAEVGATPRADFHYRRSGELELFRRAGDGPWVAHCAARLLAYRGQDVRLISPRVTRYGARSEIHARLYLVRNTTLGTGSRAALLRGHYDVRPRLRVGAGVASSADCSSTVLTADYGS